MDMGGGLLLVLTLLGCGPGMELPWRQAPEPLPPEASPGLLVLTLEDAPAARFTPWGGADDRLDAFASLGTTWLRAYAPTPLRQPNLATLWTGLPPDDHGMWLDGMQVLPDHHVLLFEELDEAGWHTATSTGTLLTDERWGLHQGARSVSVHDDVGPRALPAASVVDRLEVRNEPQAAWVHLASDGLSEAEALVGRWVEAHPEGWVVVVGVHGRGSGLSLDDDALRLPLVVVGPGFEAGAQVDDVVALHDLAPTLRALVGLAPRGTPLQDGGAEVVHHATHLGRALFGRGVLEATTETDGRVMLGRTNRWYGALGTRIPADGHIVPDDHGAVVRHRALRSEAATDVAPIAFVPLAERAQLAQVAPHTLGDPDAAAGPSDPAPGQATFVDAIRKPLQFKQYRELHRIADELEDVPFAQLLRAIAARGQADADTAALALDAGHAGATGPTFAWHRAEVALDRCRVDEAAQWFGYVQDAAPLRPAPTAALLHRALAYGPLPPELASHREALVAAWPQHPYVPPLTDPLAITLLPVRPSSPVTGLLRARADWHQGHATEAIEALRAAVALDPMDCTLRVELARWYLEADERFGAQRLLAPLLRAQPDDPVLIELADRAKVDPDDRHKRSVDRIYNRP